MNTKENYALDAGGVTESVLAVLFKTNICNLQEFQIVIYFRKPVCLSI